MEQHRPESTAVWGAGQGSLQGTQGPLGIALTMQDGSTGDLTLTMQDDGTLDGTWSDSAEELPVALQYVPSAERLEGDIGGRPLILHPVTPFEQADVGVYERVGDNATVLFALDVGLSGNTGLLSVLEPDGTWPEENRFKGEIWPGDPRIQDLDISAARFDGGDRIYACLYDWNLEQDVCDVLIRQSSQSDLNGV